MRGTRRARWAAIAAALTAAITLGACTPPSAGPNVPEQATPSGDDAIGINQLQYLGSHNSYKTAPSLGLLAVLGLGSALVPDLASAGLDPAQLAYGHRPLTDQLNSGVRSFELDVWADPTGGRFAQPLAAQLLGQPYPSGVTAPGFKVLHIQEIDYLSTCPTLVACLQEMRTWSNAHPGHLPITINLELKADPLPAPFDVTAIQPFDAPTLDSLDAEVTSVIGDRLITPDDVRGGAADLRSAVTDLRAGGGWPTVAQARGRFLMFLDNGGSVIQRYLDGHPSLAGRPLFTSDGIADDGTLRPDAAVLKLNEPGDGSRIAALVAQGFMVRTRADADVVHPGADRAAALSSGAQMVHSDFPKGEPQFGTGYEVSFPTRVQARCNPVNTTAATCSAAAAVEASTPAA